jgi:hypothetical protein
VLLKTGNLLLWNRIKDAREYVLYKNAITIATISDTVFPLTNTNGFSEYQVQCMAKGIPPSFLSNPVQVYNSNAEICIETDQDNAGNKLTKADGYSGKGYTVLNIPGNEGLKITTDIEKSGNYLVSFRFSNGSGNFTTDYSCAIRSLYLNGKLISALVFPQMEEKDNWSFWRFTAPVMLQLNKGFHTIELKYNPWNENMSGTINTASIDYVKLIEADELK